MLAVLHTFTNRLNFLIGIFTLFCAVGLGLVSLLCTISGIGLVIVFGILGFPVVGDLWRSGYIRLRQSL